VVWRSRGGFARKPPTPGRKAALVIVAVEKRGRASGRTRMAVIPDFKKTTLGDFIKGACSASFNDLYRRSQDFYGIAGSRLQAFCSSAAPKKRLAQGRQSPVPLATSSNGSLARTMA
jgi:hypothetical protein